MEKILWKIYDLLISKIFDKQITNECQKSYYEGYYDMEQLVGEKIDYWEHIYQKKLMNQSYKILFDFKKLYLPF